MPSGNFLKFVTDIHFTQKLTDLILVLKGQSHSDLTKHMCCFGKVISLERRQGIPSHIAQRFPWTQELYHMILVAKIQGSFPKCMFMFFLNIHILRSAWGTVFKFGTNIHFKMIWLPFNVRRSKGQDSHDLPFFKHNISVIPKENVITCGTNIPLDSRITWIELGGQRSRSLSPLKSHLLRSC